ncbi:hypothetical protein EG327_001703 [Venturia inaequalis]|uniref:GDP-mannose transporter n=1 Tax=Venturia inaequalis TaxID=5025 RepID=A0A8H3ZED3_VENIN|nr:hypothetical protein EG327_001703 [Venturia inaequalis]
MSFPGRILASKNIFKPALHYLSNLDPSNKAPSSPQQKYADQNDIDNSPPGPSHTQYMAPLRPWHSRDSSGELDHAGGIPLIDYSRTPSPSPYRTRTRSATQSEDEDEAVPLSLRPLVSDGEDDMDELRKNWWRFITKSGSLGEFLFGTWLGWQVWVCLLIIWNIGVGFTLTLMNRFILWTGTYKFPYPLAATFIQLAFTHGFLLLAASITRGLANPLKKMGFSALVAPAYPSISSRPSEHRRRRFNPLRLVTWIFDKSGGIAGGGLLDFDRKTAWSVLPLALVYVGKVVLSNISYAYAPLSLYTLSRTPIIPITLLLTSLLTRTNHSIATLSSTLVAALMLMTASIRRSERLTWESIVAGVFSTLFVSLYPILLLLTHKQLTTRQVPHSDILSSYEPASQTAARGAQTPGSGTKEETRAYWQLLHYTSMLSLMILSPLLVLSGELRDILRNCYFLDVPWFWFLSLLGGLASFAVFSTTLAFIRATSPLTGAFVGVPRAAWQMVVLERFRLPVHAWVGVGICWLSSLWFVWVRREESRKWELRRIGRERR